MTLRRLLAATSVLACCAALPAGAQTRGGTLVFGRAIESQFLDPTRTEQNADIWISLNLYDTLVQPTADGKGVQPGLASAWATSDDGKTVTFTMRPGLEFADGSALQPSDVAWSLNQARAKPAGGEFAFLLSSIADVQPDGADKVVVTLTRPDPVILQALATFNAGIMPEKLVMAAPGATIDDKRKAFADHPVGSGPFTLQSWQRNTEMVLVRNEHYWRKAADGKPLPYLDQVRLQIIPDDATRILKLRAGELDIAEFVPYSRVAELKADPKLDMVLFPAAQVNYFALNARPTFKDGSKNPMADVRVRQALNYATNKQALIQAVSYGAGTAQHSYMPMSTPLSYGPAELYPYNIAKAKQLLADAGYPSGFEVTAMALAGSADDAAKLTILQQIVEPGRGPAEDRAVGRRHPPGPLQRRGLPDARVACGPTTSTTPTRSPPSWPTTRRGRPAAPAGRTRRWTTCSTLASPSWTRPSGPTNTSRSSKSTRRRRRSCSPWKSPTRWRCASRCTASSRSRWATTCSSKPRSTSSALHLLAALGRRLLQIAATVVVVALLVFGLMRLLPGDPAIMLLGDRASDANIAAAAPRTGAGPLHRGAVLGVPAPHRHAAPGRQHHPARAGVDADPQRAADHADADRHGGGDRAADRGAARLPVGAAARMAGSTRSSGSASQVSLSMPVFYIGLVLLITLAAGLRWFPVGGIGNGFFQDLYYLFLPALTLALSRCRPYCCATCGRR